MADVQHSAIADPNIHEPKGVASAAAGTVYVANGTGSGTWTRALPLGVDTATSGQVLVANGVGGATWQANSPVSPDYGEIFIQNNAVATTIATINTFVQATSGVTAGQLDGVTVASNSLVVAASAKYILEAEVTLFGVAATPIDWNVDFLLNGAAFGRKQTVSTTGTEKVTIGLRAITGTLSVGDAISLGIANATDTNDPTIVHASLTIRQL